MYSALDADDGLEAGDLAGDGARNPYKSQFVRRIDMTDEEKRDLLAFLEALTDRSVTSDPELSDPFAER